MSAPIILYLDTTNKRLIANFLSVVAPFQGITLEAGDLVPVQLHFLTQNPSSGTSGQLPYAYADPATLTPIGMAIGEIGLQPTAGTFTVTFNASTTSALAYNISASALSVALNALAPIISLGGVTVVGSAGGPWTVTFTATGAPGYEFVINASELAPVSQGLTAVAIAGATGVQEQEVLTLLQSPAALQNTWTATYGAMAVTRVQAGGSGNNEIQQITVPQGTYAGSFQLSFGSQGSTAIPYNTSASNLQTILQALSSIGANNCTVIQVSPVSWNVTFVGTLANAGQSLIVANSAGLSMPMYAAANLNLNVQGIFNLLAGAASTSATLQIQQGTSGNVNTVLLTTVTLSNTLILGTPSVPNPANPWQTLSQVNALIAAAAYVLPAATTSVLGGVIVPASGHLSVDGSGNITVALGSSSVFGVVKVDNTTISASSGIISAIAQGTRVTANFPITSSAALTNVTGLTANLAAGQAYSFEAVLFTTANASGGIQAAIAGTATATSIEYEGELTAAGAIVNQTRANALGGAVCASTTTTAGTIWITGTILVNNAGTLTVQFAQNSSYGTASNVLAGSWFRVWPTAN
jgi:hypothetical protein